MNANDLNAALYEKMAAEQDQYRDWLKSQPPEEILHHAYEHSVREDIVMAMEELELTDAQAGHTGAGEFALSMDHLDFLMQCHARQRVLDALFDGCIVIQVNRLRFLC